MERYVYDSVDLRCLSLPTRASMDRSWSWAMIWRCAQLPWSGKECVGRKWKYGRRLNGSCRQRESYFELNIMASRGQFQTNESCPNVID